MKRKWQIDRRTALKYLGVSISLPYLEIMGVGSAFGATDRRRSKFIYAFFPNGAAMPGGIDGDWTADAYEGQSGALAALWQSHRANLQILRGMTFEHPHEERREGGKPNGNLLDYDPHWEHSGTMLNCARPLSNGYNSPGVSEVAKKTLDQYIASRHLPSSPLRSLHIGLPDMENNSHDKGGIRHPAFWNSLSWASDAQSVGNTFLPQELFARVFGAAPAPASGGGGDSSAADYIAFLNLRRKSVLDLVLDQLKSLNRKASGADRLTLDKYATEVFEINKAFQTTSPTQNPPASGAGCSLADLKPRDFTAGELRSPAGFVSTEAYKLPFQLMQRIIVKSMQCDLTSTATIAYMPVFADEGEFQITGIGGKPHGPTHLYHMPGQEAEKAQYKRQVRLFVETWSHLISELKNTGMINETIAWLGSDMSGGEHNDANIPAVLAGAGGDLGFTPEGRVVGGRDRPRRMADLLREIGIICDAPATQWGSGNRAARGDSIILG